MRHRIRPAVYLALLVTCVSFAWAKGKPSQPTKMVPVPDQRETLTLGTVDLVLGEPKDAAVSRLKSAGYSVLPLADSDRSFWVLLRTGAKEPTFLGEIGVERDGKRLTFISRSYELEPTAISLATMLYFAVKRLEEENCKDVRLSTEMMDRPGFQDRFTVATCNGTHRSLKVTTYQPTSESNQAPAIAELIEVLQSADK